VTGVPFFVLDRRYGISGAQPVEAFHSALKTASTRRGPPARRAWTISWQVAFGGRWIFTPRYRRRLDPAVTARLITGGELRLWMISQ